MSKKVAIHRLSTGVPGLDEILGGGLPEFSFNLIAGPPGSGKTTLAHQLMFALATAKRPALYFTVLGEPPLKMLRYQQQFDFFDNEAINRSIRFVNLSEDASIVGAMISMGSHLHMRVVAEGVETREQLVFLQGHECPFGQGYYFSQPVAARECAQLLRRGIAITGNDRS